ncbi:MAG TPA: peptidyl-prolyl cis-trans isomerase [Vicinamibacterales bacterium]
MTMLDRMRRHKNWLKWSLGLVVLTFIAFYATDFVNTPTSTIAGTAAPNEVVAEIEGRTLTAGEFQRRYLTQMQAYTTAYGGNVNEQLLKQLGIDRQILQQMIDEQAALAEAERQGIRVSDEELAQQIFAIPGLQENGRFIGEARYEQLLRSQRPPMTKFDFEQNLRRSMMIDKLRAVLTDWMAVSEPELEREYKQRNEKVKLQVVALTADRFRDQVTVTDQDVETFFNQRQAEYRMGEQRRVRMLLLDRDAARAKVNITPAEVETYYKNNTQQYQTPEQVRASHILFNTAGKDEAAVQKQAEEILKRAQAGEDFAALAKQYSEDEGSKVNGGDLDYFARGRMVPEFEQAAFNTEPGQITNLVKSQFGFHIIKVVDKRAATTTPLDSVRAQIQDNLAWQRVDQQLNGQSTRVAGRLKTPADLDTVAKENGLTVVESGFFQRGDPVPGLGAAPSVSASAFTLADNVVSGALQTPRGPVFVTVSGKRDPYVPKLDEVKDRVREDLIRSRATDLSRQRAGQIAAALKAVAGNFTAAAKAQGLEAKDTELVARASALPDVGVSPEVDKVAFSMPAGSVSDPITTGDGTVIVRVVERDEVTPEEFRPAKETFRTELLNERRGRFFTAYMNRAKEKMAIEINNDVIRRVVGV